MRSFPVAGRSIQIVKKVLSEVLGKHTATRRMSY
jgi:hypothetical protein